MIYYIRVYIYIYIYSILFCTGSSMPSRCSSGFDLSFLDPKAPPDVATVPKDAEILPSVAVKNSKRGKKRKRRAGISYTVDITMLLYDILYE